MILVVDEVIQVVGAGFVHGIEGVVEFVPLDIDAALPRVFQLSEDLLGFRDLRRFAFHFDPAFASRDFHAERFFEVLDQFQIVGVKRLHGPRILKLQGARFSHLAAGTSSAARIRLRPEECQTVGRGTQEWQTGGLALTDSKQRSVPTGSRKPAPSGSALPANSPPPR